MLDLSVLYGLSFFMYPSLFDYNYEIVNNPFNKPYLLIKFSDRVEVAGGA